jgi:hypothetical protein
VSDTARNLPTNKEEQRQQAAFDPEPNMLMERQITGGWDEKATAT